MSPNEVRGLLATIEKPKEKQASCDESKVGDKHKRSAESDFRKGAKSIGFFTHNERSKSFANFVGGQKQFSEK